MTLKISCFARASVTGVFFYLGVALAAQPPEERKLLPAPPPGKPGATGEKKTPRPRDIRAEMIEFDKEMNDRVIEQAEAVELISDIEWAKRAYGYGKREFPEVMYLMGGPALGKDTSVEAYIETMYRPIKNAFRDHVYRMDVAKEKADLWREFGSNTGYVGSENLSPLIRWLVEHSCGKYQFAKTQGDGSHRNREATPFVIPNKDWKAGEPCPEGTYSPEDAILFVNEFHDWGKSVKSALLKQALEKGYFPINNPGPGLKEIVVPVTIVIASNEGLNLVAARTSTGQRVGKKLTYEQMVEKWSAVRHDKQALKDTILATNASTADDPRDGGGGINEEMLRRIPDQNVILMKPISSEGLKRIAFQKLMKLRQKLSEGTGALGPVTLRWTEAVRDMVALENYDPEAGAGKVKDNVGAFVERVLFDAMKDGRIPTDGQKKHYLIDVEELPDGTLNLIFRRYAEALEAVDQALRYTEEFRQPIRASLSRRPPERLGTDRIDQLARLEREMSEQVFGVSPILSRLARAVLVGEERAQAGKTGKGEAVPARAFMALGLSSTGKTETFKALARVLYGSEDNLVVLDFSQIRTVQDLKEKILGTQDGLGRPIKSDFMEHYDRLNGKVLFVFDEIANAPRDVLKALYDILREAEIQTFSDRKTKAPRKMTNVMIGMTGNAGEEWFSAIPRNIPVLEQQAAMEEIYKEAMKDPEGLRGFLEKYFSGALLNRIGENNIFFFPPISFKTLREITQLKVNQALRRLEESPGRWGWKIKFQRESDYVALLSSVERHGFVLWEQGASIDRYVKQEFEEILRNQLLQAHVPSGSEVVLSYLPPFAEEKDDLDANPVSRFALISGDGTQRQVLELAKLKREVPERVSDIDRIITAYHEVGHELVRQALFADKYRSEKITVVPGVAEINHRWVHYLGLARYHNVEYVTPTRQAIIHQMAILLGGEAAQEIVTKEYDGGKSNDIERATEMARTAILRYGLSPAWGNEAAPAGVAVADYAQSLSGPRRQLFDRELHSLLNEARSLAREVLLANFDTIFTPMSVALAELGTLERPDLEAFYREHPPVNPLSASRVQHWMATLLHRTGNRDARLIRGVPRPATVANIEAITNKRHADGIAAVPLTRVAVTADPERYASAAGALQQEVRAQIVAARAETRAPIRIPPAKKAGCLSLLARAVGR